MTSKINAAIIGGAGYTGGELIRLLLQHPNINGLSVQSESNEGKQVGEVHQDLIGVDLTFLEKPDSSSDVVFLCGGHGNAKSSLEKYTFHSNCKIIDLSHDHRLDPSFAYGLPEVFKKSIKDAGKVANPGCFATAIQLGLVPAINAGIVSSPIHTNAITGSTGAGFKPTATTHFSWRSNNVSIYKAFEHQHLAEIHQTFETLGGNGYEVNFIPVRGPFTRGILATSYFKYKGSENDLKKLYESFYKDEPFTFLTDQEPDIKQVVNSNRCHIKVSVVAGKALLISVIDNLVKGASGQAVQNMNLMFGFEETAGLQLKATAF